MNESSKIRIHRLGRLAAAGLFLAMWAALPDEPAMAAGVQETQDMLNFCGEHKITANIERTSLPKINDALARLRRNDVKYRFVIDMQLR